MLVIARRSVESKIVINYIVLQIRILQNIKVEILIIQLELCFQKITPKLLTKKAITPHLQVSQTHDRGVKFVFACFSKKL